MTPEPCLAVVMPCYNEAATDRTVEEIRTVTDRRG